MTTCGAKTRREKSLNCLLLFRRTTGRVGHDALSRAARARLRACAFITDGRNTPQDPSVARSQMRTDPPARSCSVWLLAGYLARGVVLRSEVEHTHVMRARNRVVQREAIRPVDGVAEDLAPVVDHVVTRLVPRQSDAVAQAVQAQGGGGVAAYGGQDVRPAGEALVRCGHAG